MSSPPSWPRWPDSAGKRGLEASMRIPELMIVLLAAEVLLIGVVLLLTPRLTRPDIWFSVTVDPGFPSSPEGRRILRGFRVWSLLACAAAVAIVMAALATKA